MQQSEVLSSLKSYITNEILNGRDIGLEATTPLLEWGVINSLEIVRLLSFIRNQYAIQIPSEKVTAEHFKDLSSLTQLVLESAQESTISAT
jgi:acyl carrier protein